MHITRECKSSLQKITVFVPSIPRCWTAVVTIDNVTNLSYLPPPSENQINASLLLMFNVVSPKGHFNVSNKGSSSAFSKA